MWLNVSKLRLAPTISPPHRRNPSETRSARGEKRAKASSKALPFSPNPVKTFSKAARKSFDACAWAEIIGCVFMHTLYSELELLVRIYFILLSIIPGVDARHTQHWHGNTPHWSYMHKNQHRNLGLFSFFPPFFNPLWFLSAISIMLSSRLSTMAYSSWVVWGHGRSGLCLTAADSPHKNNWFLLWCEV